MSEQTIKPCPGCGSDSHTPFKLPIGSRYGRYCLDCNLGGPLAKTAARADEFWNALPRRTEFRWGMARMERILNAATNEHCSCGGDGPGDGCLACKVYHDFIEGWELELKARPMPGGP